MFIKLRRAFTPAEMGEEERCAVCGRVFRPESVQAIAIAGRGHVGKACMSCVEYLGGRNPYDFPTLEEYAAALERYPEPVWPSVEEATRVSVEDGAAFVEACEASWIGREESLEK